jgi:threonine dehydrogenase-like Zn-dependent dehydrogenase
MEERKVTMTDILLAAPALAIIQPCRYIARPRQKLAREFGATDVVSECGGEAVERVRELTDGFGVHSVLECVGTEQSMYTAISIARSGGAVGRVGVPQEQTIPGSEPAFC